MSRIYETGRGSFRILNQRVLNSYHNYGRLPYRNYEALPAGTIVTITGAVESMDGNVTNKLTTTMELLDWSESLGMYKAGFTAPWVSEELGLTVIAIDPDDIQYIMAMGPEDLVPKKAPDLYYADYDPESDAAVIFRNSDPSEPAVVVNDYHLIDPEDIVSYLNSKLEKR